VALDPTSGDQSIGQLGQGWEADAECTGKIRRGAILRTESSESKELRGRNRLAPGLDGHFGTENPADSSEEIK
jgi:hypothetical protein